MPEFPAARLWSQSAGSTSLLNQVMLFPFGGAAARSQGGDTAFGYRSTQFIFVMITAWTDPVENARHIQWTRDVWAVLEPFASGGVYVNDLNDEGPEGVKTAYEPATYRRLAELKRKYDPTNLFHMNQDIRPGA